MILRICSIYPGKRGIVGYHIPTYVKNEQWLDLTSYCEGDVLNTWLIFLRWALLKGQLSQHDHQLWIQATIHYLQGLPQQAEFYRYGVKLHNTVSLPHKILNLSFLH